METIQKWTPIKKTTQFENMDTTNTPNLSSWVTWTNAFSFADSLAEGEWSATSNKNLKKALMSLHIALQAVDNSFITAIGEINNGTTPSITINPAPINNWNKKNTLLDIILKAIDPILSEVIQQLQKTTEAAKYSQVIIAIGGLINSIPQVIKALKENK